MKKTTTEVFLMHIFFFFDRESTGFWSHGGGGSFRSSRSNEPLHSRYDSNRSFDRSDFDNERPFPAPPTNYGSSYDNSGPMDRPSRDMR